MTQNNQRTVSIEEAIQIGDQLYQNGQFEQSSQIYKQILDKQPANDHVTYLLATCCISMEKFVEARSLLNKVIQLNPNNDAAYSSFAHINSILGNEKQSIDLYNKALTLNPNNIQALNNLGIIYNNHGDNLKAISYFEKFLKIIGENAVAYNNICLCYMKMARYNEALQVINHAIKLKENHHEFHYNAALVNIALANKSKAIEHYRRSLELNPTSFTYLNEYKELLKGICDWDEIAKIQRQIDMLDPKGQSVLPPMYDIQSQINPKRNLETAIRFTKSRVDRLLAIKEQYKHAFPPKEKGRVRIGYVSSDIKNHPVAHLMRGVFKNHDRNKFDIHLYSTGPDDNSEHRKDIEKYVENFIDAHNLDDFALAKRIYDDQIDILIDLNGHTGASKLEAKSLKPAPLAVSYIGFIGSMGADFIDYIITDETVTPKDQQEFYTEKFIYMPDCYQVNDNELKISDKEVSRKDYGLPDDAIVFCSFNQTYKHEPEMFNTWMNILKRVENSVLWLYRGSFHKSDVLAVENLKKEAEKRGVDSSRLVFADLVEISEHLKRTSLADLALDTRIYNGGTVTSNTLWSGVPLITLEGGHFASRMAASILSALGMKELITKDLTQYEELAVDLAKNPEKLKAERDKLAKNRLNKPLFDTQRFVRNLENAYQTIWENYKSGNKPKLIRIEERLL